MSTHIDGRVSSLCVHLQALSPMSAERAQTCRRGRPPKTAASEPFIRAEPPADAPPSASAPRGRATRSSRRDIKYAMSDDDSDSDIQDDIVPASDRPRPRCLPASASARESVSTATSPRGRGRPRRSPTTTAAAEKRPASPEDFPLAAKRKPHLLLENLQDEDRSLTPDSGLDTPTATPSTPIPPTAPLTPLQEAKIRLTLGHTPGPLTERDDEKKRILDFIRSHCEDNRCGSLYISGQPGTGKSALIRELQPDILALTRPVFVNCMSLQSPQAVFPRLYSQLEPKNPVLLGTDEARSALDGLLLEGRKGLRLVILDEIDRLEARENDVLYQLFQWAAVPGSSLLLIGVANALDLTDRILPMLKRHDCAPELMNFQPYNAMQLFKILKRKLADLPSPVLTDAALMFCAAKVGAQGGDLRCAMNISRRVLDLIEAEPDKKQTDLVHRICSGVFGNDIRARIRALPLHQQVILCTLYCMRVNDKEVKASNVRRCYLDICKRVSLPPVQDGFYAMLQSLQSLTFLEITSSKNILDSKVRLRIKHDDLKFVFEGGMFFPELLDLHVT
eukprot:m.71024 g.71024  ORF g.71024 m.71024 type:complete len:563 (-) comp50162_c0_seq2:43-1731(-)